MGRKTETDIWISVVKERLSKEKPDTLTETTRVACGFSHEEAHQVLIKEFARLHDGIAADTFKLCCIWEDIKSKKLLAIKNIKSDRQLRLVMLPFFVTLMNDKWQKMATKLKVHKELTPAWVDYVNKLYPTPKATEPYDPILKGLERIIANNINDKNYKKYRVEIWNKYRDKVLKPIIS